MRTEQIEAVVGPMLEQFALELDAVEVKPAGKRTMVRVIVDGDGSDGSGPSLDDIAEATKAVSTALDDSDATGAGSYTLEVTSRGVSRPLTLPRHWRRNVGRLVRVTVTGGESVTGRIVAATEDSATLDVDGTERSIDLDEVGKALIQIEMNRKPADPSSAGGTPKEN